MGFTMLTKLLLTRWLNTPNLRTFLRDTRLTDGKFMTLMDMTLNLLRPPSKLPRTATTESPSSSNATPLLEREWKKLREPTLLTERLVFHTLRRPSLTLESLREKAGTFLREHVTTSRMSRPRTRPPTTNGKLPSQPGLRPTQNLPS